MTLRLLIASAVVALVGVVSLSPAEGASRGANPGFAGDQQRETGEAVTCAACHNAAAPNTGPGEVAIKAPASAAPGESVTVEVTLSEAALQSGGRQGFQATVRDPVSGDLWGALVLTDATDTKFSGPDEAYVTHTTAGTARRTWTFEWAPGAERSGTARIYVAANAANNDGSTTGDLIYTATADVAMAPVAIGPSVPAFEVGAPSPSPARAGQPLRLDVTLREPGSLAVRLVDVTGRTVRRAEAAAAAGPTTVRLETAGLAAGLYVAVVEGPRGVRTRPLVVVR